MPLSSKQKQSLRAALAKRRDALLAELRDDASRIRAEPFAALAGEAPDSADESVADLIADSDQADLSRDLEELRAVDAALARLAKGGYGVCVDCGADIEPGRLKAAPWASRCVACQRRHEKTHSGGPGAKL